MGGEHIDWVSVGFSFFNFAVLVGILLYFGGPRIRELLAKRHATIKKDVEEARALREQAELRLREYEARLAGIEREMAELIEGIKQEAEAEAVRIIRAAEEAAERLHKEAEFLLGQEQRQLEIELRREAAGLAVELARKILLGKMTDLDQRRLLDQFVREMAGGAVVSPRDGAVKSPPGPQAQT